MRVLSFEIISGFLLTADIGTPILVFMDIQNVLSQLQEAGLTQTQIAAGIGCTQPTVSELLSGKIGQSNPSYKIVDGLKKLAKKHGISTKPHKQSVR
jgi:predicted XRE-type DNA-binding protein